MKRYASHISLIAALLAVPAAQAGSEIVKCVDRDGHVTLTDLACDAGAAAIVLSSGAVAAGAAAPGAERSPAPRAQARSAAPRKPEMTRMNLSRDVATLKEAHAQLLLMDASRGQPRLAGLD
jgi:glutamate 5-kinase